MKAHLLVKHCSGFGPYESSKSGVYHYHMASFLGELEKAITEACSLGVNSVVTADPTFSPFFPGKIGPSSLWFSFDE